MTWKLLSMLVVLRGLCCVCLGQDQPPSGRYIRKAGKERVFVFVHGVHGSPSETWTAANGTYWPRLLETDHAFDNSDVYVTGYNTPYVGSTATVPDIAESLFQFLEADSVFTDHREVIFVCHSLGGLVVEQMLLQHRTFAKQVPFIVSYSTPHTGSAVANFASVFVDDPLVKAMMAGGGNNYLTSLERIWEGSGFTTRRYCTYELKTTKPRTWHGYQIPAVLVDFINGILVVDPISATYGCDNSAIPVGISEDHLGMVKPDGLRHLSHITLRNLQMNSPIGPAPTSPVAVRFAQPICAFYGESSSGSNAWHKTEVCSIPNAPQLDPDYRQTDLVFAGGGAKSDMDPKNIPPGLEVRADGGYYWSVLNGRRDGGNYYIDTYCGPAPKPGPGCNVKVKIVGHYRIMSTASVAEKGRTPSPAEDASASRVLSAP